MGIQGVTGDYKGFSGVTRGDRGLQGVTGGTKNYRNFFLTRTFPDTLCWSVLHKKSESKKSQIFDQNNGLTPLEKKILEFFQMG